MSLAVFWIIVFASWGGVAYLTYLYIQTRKHTNHNTRRIGKLEFTVEELWDLIHNKKK